MIRCGGGEQCSLGQKSFLSSWDLYAAKYMAHMCSIWYILTNAQIHATQTLRHNIVHNIFSAPRKEFQTPFYPVFTLFLLSSLPQFGVLRIRSLQLRHLGSGTGTIGWQEEPPVIGIDPGSQSTKFENPSEYFKNHQNRQDGASSAFWIFEFNIYKFNKETDSKDFFF